MLDLGLLLGVLLLIVITVLLQPRLRRWWKRLHYNLARTSTTPVEACFAS